MCVTVDISRTGKKYTLLDGVALLCMSVGLILFTLADSTVQPDFNQTGELKFTHRFVDVMQGACIESVDRIQLYCTYTISYCLHNLPSQAGDKANNSTPYF